MVRRTKYGGTRLREEDEKANFIKINRTIRYSEIKWRGVKTDLADWFFH
jgi:hypothetical protein